MNVDINKKLVNVEDVKAVYDLISDERHADIDTINKTIDNLRKYTDTKPDGIFYEDSYLYLTCNGEIVSDGVHIVSGSGGGSGGGGEVNNAVLTLQNNMEWITKNTVLGESCYIDVNWNSLENDLETGLGSLFVYVNYNLKESKTVNQGNVKIDVSSYLNTGMNTVKIKVADVYGNSRSLNFNITILDLSLTSTFSSSIVYDSEIAFPYTPNGDLEKIVYFILDGEVIGTDTILTSGRQQKYYIPKQSHGGHTLEVYFVANVNGEEVESNKLYYEFISTEENNNTPIITSSFNSTSAKQYETINIKYNVYSPSAYTTDIKLYVNNVLETDLSVDRTRQTWSYRLEEIGDIELKIETTYDTIQTISKIFNINVSETAMDLNPETNDLGLYLIAQGRSNNELNPAIWKYNDIACSFNNFNFVSNGWINDEDGVTVLRLSGDARLTIPYKIFEKDFRTTGKTIEIEFATHNIMDYDTVLFDCMSDNRGLQLTAQKGTLNSEQTSSFTQYKEDEHVRLSFVVEKRAENKLIHCYINGILSSTIQYSDTDDFSQTNPVNITIGSNECTTDIYCIRVYDNNLTRHQLLDNWIYDTGNLDFKLERYERNDIFDAYGNIVISRLPNYLPYMVLQSEELPQYKGDKKTISGYYTDPLNPKKSFTFENAQFDVQGTSSQYYARKNYKGKFKGGFYINGSTTASDNYAMNDNAIPTNVFTFKADVASSEGCNNVEIVKLYNDINPYKTAPQKENENIRQGIDGFPMVVFWDNGSTTTFIGKYNFNNDKGTPEVFGFDDNDESWEILNNTSNRVLWKSDDFSTDEWQNDFEARHPEENFDVTKLQALSTWINSTDQSQATNQTLETPKTYDDVQYTSDTMEYRLAKFKSEFTNYFAKDAIVFNYIITELFLMVDNRAKNMFPTIYDEDGKWIILPYDYDTAIGINNEGTLAFSYYLEDIDKTETGEDVYNGQNSVLWVNFRQAFFEDIKKMYQDLRSKNLVSYDIVEERFENHQAKWSEAIFNEDAYFKYLEPLIKDNNAAYLSMLQGSKAEQRKWWLYNRFRYIDSKYNAGDSLTDVITLRGYAKDNITITPYADIYASIKYGSYLTQKRAFRNNEYTLDCPLDNVNDTEIYIYSASQLKSIGDISGLKVGYADFTNATKIQSLKIGDSASSYVNNNLTTLYFGNNVLLKLLDVRNCPNLFGAVDVSGCVSIEELYFDGTNITSINLPNGDTIKKLHLPSTITNLTLLNQSKIEDLSIPSYSSITTLRLENVNLTIDSLQILKTIPSGSRVRIIGFSYEVSDVDELFALVDLFDTMRGLDEYNNNMDLAQLSGTVHVPSLTGTQMKEIQDKYPFINIKYDHITSYLYYYNYDGSTLLYTESIYDGGDGIYTGKPTRTSTAQYDFTFAGWATTPNGSVNTNAQKGVTADRNIYAAYTSTTRKYTVYFYNGTTLLQTVQNVAYGSSATYTGTTPVSPDGSADDYPFEGWIPSNTNITGNTSCKAQFGSPLEIKEIEDSWEEIIASVNDGSYATKYKIGNYKPLDLGTEGIINMQIAGKNVDILADGSGTAPLTWISKELLKSHHTTNPFLVTNYNTEERDTWIADTEPNSWKSNIVGLNSISVTATWGITALESGTLTINYKVSSEINCDLLTIKVNNSTVVDRISGDGDWLSYDVECSSGDIITVRAIYSKDITINTYDDTSYINFTSTNEINISANIDTITVETTIINYQEGTGTIGGWEKSEMRSYLKNTIKPLIPELVCNTIKEVTKTQNAYDINGNSYLQTTQDDVWIPSETEVSYYNNGDYKSLFFDNTSRIKNKVGYTTSEFWWLRNCINYTSFPIILSNGAFGSATSSNTNISISLGFCM